MNTDKQSQQNGKPRRRRIWLWLAVGMSLAVLTTLVVIIGILVNSLGNPLKGQAGEELVASIRQIDGVDSASLGFGSTSGGLATVALISIKAKPDLAQGAAVSLLQNIQQKLSEVDKNTKMRVTYEQPRLGGGVKLTYLVDREHPDSLARQVEVLPWLMTMTDGVADWAESDNSSYSKNTLSCTLQKTSASLEEGGKLLGVDVPGPCDEVSRMWQVDDSISVTVTGDQTVNITETWLESIVSARADIKNVELAVMGGDRVYKISLRDPRKLPTDSPEAIRVTDSLGGVLRETSNMQQGVATVWIDTFLPLSLENSQFSVKMSDGQSEEDLTRTRALIEKIDKNSSIL